MDGNSSITINAIMPKLGFSLVEASGSSLSGSKNKGKALQGSGLRKKGLTGLSLDLVGHNKKVIKLKSHMRKLVFTNLGRWWLFMR
ncbi:hypothetical protein Golob_006865 [Gossypium lobatum]|uniref:Uncharacterized protein n=1 Tax=Gossypium lobatum TaxID=34289 RepID=A0A7J8NEN9_9ROSI|nr:hypothetical protein [Gossypium lobatum]